MEKKWHLMADCSGEAKVLRGSIDQIEGKIEAGLYSKDFSHAFCKLLQKAGISCYQISKYSHLDQGYLSRLKSGEETNPSPETIVRISLAFVRHSEKISVHDIDNLFRSVGRSLRIKY